MPNAIRIHRTGGPEVLVLEPVEVAPPGAGEVRIRHTFVGVNFVDTYNRSGLYPQMISARSSPPGSASDTRPELLACRQG